MKTSLTRYFVREAPTGPYWNGETFTATAVSARALTARQVRAVRREARWLGISIRVLRLEVVS